LHFAKLKRHGIFLGRESMSKRTSVRLVVREDPDQIIAEKEEVQARIRQRAYEISVSRGHAGREMEDWLVAESEIISVPPVELAENDDGFMVRAALPGIGPEDIEVVTTPEQVLIKGALRSESEPTVVHIREFNAAPVFRCLRFPEAIDVRSLKVKSENGLLTITAPKASVASNGNGSKAATTTRPKRSAPKVKARRMAG
jgi:HSP20 family protein